jgi:hypothetical protein
MAMLPQPHMHPAPVIHKETLKANDTRATYDETGNLIAVSLRPAACSCREGVSVSDMLQLVDVSETGLQTIPSEKLKQIGQKNAQARLC